MNLKNDGLTTINPRWDICSLIRQYSEVSDANRAALLEEEAIQRLGFFLGVGSTVYLQISESGIRKGTDPVHVLHIGASVVELLFADCACRALRELVPGLPEVHHSFVGPDVGLLPYQEMDDHPAMESFGRLFPHLPWRREPSSFFIPKTLEGACDDDSFAGRLFGGWYDLLLFFNPGFLVDTPGQSWAEDDALQGLLAEVPDVNIAGCSQDPIDFSSDKVFLEGFGRSIKRAVRNPYSRYATVDVGSWASVVWSSRPLGYKGKTLRKSSVEDDTAAEMIREASRYAPWRNAGDLAISRLPGEFIRDMKDCVWVLPDVVLNLKTGSLFSLCPNGHEERLGTVEKDGCRYALKGDYWDRLDAALQVMDELGVPRSDEGDAVWDEILKGAGKFLRDLERG